MIHQCSVAVPLKSFPLGSTLTITIINSVTVGAVNLFWCTPPAASCSSLPLRRPIHLSFHPPVRPSICPPWSPLYPSPILCLSVTLFKTICDTCQFVLTYLPCYLVTASRSTGTPHSRLSSTLSPPTAAFHSTWKPRLCAAHSHSSRDAFDHRLHFLFQLCTSISGTPRFLFPAVVVGDALFRDNCMPDGLVSFLLLL